MEVSKTETFPLKTEMDIVQARQMVRAWSIQLGFRLVDQTKVVTAASELARNTVIYGGGGEMTLSSLSQGIKKGLKLVFVDHGPGIPDVALALKDGYTSGNGMGMGLGGSKRLVNEFEIDSRVGEGTRITAVKWT